MIGLLLLAGLFGPPAAAPEADGLYRQGNAAAEAERWDEALSLWAQAEARAPRWQYAFNQATVLAFLGRPADAWAACERARAHGLPPERVPEVDAEQRRVEEALLPDHAVVSLTVDPAGAEVQLDGVSLPPPHRAVVRRPASRLVVALPGHAAVDEAWSHPIGARTHRTVRLTPQPAVIAPGSGDTSPGLAALAVGGPPSSGDASRGLASPATGDAAVPPAAVSPDPGDASGGPAPLWKWVAFGVGAAAGTAGGVLLADAEDRRRPSIFESEAAAAETAYTDRRDPGLALAITSGVALATGVVLWLLEGGP